MEHFIEPDDDDEPYAPSPVANAIGAAVIVIIIGMAFYGGAQIVRDIL